jgi:lysophospholipase L1-like esterase
VEFNRRNFLKYSALFFSAAAISPNQVFSFNNLYSPKNELQMLVLGDSVMWGQGLLEEQKFWFLTKQWLEKETGKTVIPRVEAHSGATILWRNDQKYPLDRLSTFNGKLNLSTPTIIQQIENAAQFYGNRREEVDLVLVNGGINDFKIVNLVNFFRSEGWIEKRCRRIFGQDMFGLLEAIQKSFGNARIVVTGYYPVVSPDTPPERICSLQEAILNEKLIKKILSFLHISKAPLDVCSFNSVKENLNRLIQRLSRNSAAWQSQSNTYLEQTVSEFNKKYPFNSTVSDNQRAIFVKAPFSSKNAYAAPETYL